jgi:hypothetical protein
MPQKTIESDYNDYKVVTHQNGTHIVGSDDLSLRNAKEDGTPVDEYYEFFPFEEEEIIKYMNKKLGYDVCEATQTYYITDFRTSDSTEVIEALHEAIFFLLDQPITKWANENYESYEYGV